MIEKWAKRNNKRKKKRMNAKEIGIVCYPFALKMAWADFFMHSFAFHFLPLSLSVPLSLSLSIPVSHTNTKLANKLQENIKAYTLQQNAAHSTFDTNKNWLCNSKFKRKMQIMRRNKLVFKSNWTECALIALDCHIIYRLA